jgi:hypothetical protein
MPSADFEPAVPAIERLTYSLRLRGQLTQPVQLLVGSNCAYLTTYSWQRPRQRTRNRSVMSSGTAPQGDNDCPGRAQDPVLSLRWRSTPKGQTDCQLQSDFNLVMLQSLTTVPYCGRSAIITYVRTNCPTQIALPFRIQSRWHGTNSSLAQPSENVKCCDRPRS